VIRREGLFFRQQCGCEELEVGLWSGGLGVKIEVVS